jgi:hypothetical protein
VSCFLDVRSYLTENTVSIIKAKHTNVHRSSCKLSVGFVQIERISECMLTNANRNLKFNENPLVGIELFHKDRPRNMMKPEVTIHFAHAPEKHKRLTPIFSCQSFSVSGI